MILLKGYKPIAFESDTTLIVSKKNKVFRYDIEIQKMHYLASFPWSLKQKILSMNRIAYRITRGGIRNGMVFEQSLYCAYSGIIWRLPLDGSSGKAPEAVFRFKNGNSPLTFTLVDNDLSFATGFAPGIYFGEYFSNPDKKKVDIYRIDKLGTLENVYTFTAGQINHIHNIVFDTLRRCAWVMTGDFESGAGIWQASAGFGRVACIAGGEQHFRSCVAFSVKEGLLYATDSQFEQNHIRLLTVDEPSVRSLSLFPINGPCIYGTDLCGNYIFTTATEPDVGANVTAKDLITRKSGQGVVKNRSFIYLVTQQFKIYEVLSNGKDIWPYYLAQFGNILTPPGKNPSAYLVTYSVANRINDQSTEIRHWEEVKKMAQL
jgi:hypothetical protein